MLHSFPLTNSSSIGRRWPGRPPNELKAWGRYCKYKTKADAQEAKNASTQRATHLQRPLITGLPREQTVEGITSAGAFKWQEECERMAGFTKQTLLIRTHHGTTRQRSQSNQIPIVAVFSDSGLQLPHIIDRGWTWQLERLMMNSLGTFESLRHGRWYSLALERIRPSRLQETASAGWRNMTFNNPGDFFQRETTTLYTPCTTSCGFLLNQIDFPPSIDHKLQYVSACAPWR